MPRRTLVLALPLFLALASCGGGGGGSSGPTQPPPPTRGIVFTPEGAGANGISLAAGAATDASTLVLEVRANSVTDLYGVAFELRYPTTLLRFNRATAGPFLSGANLEVAPSATGTLILGLSKLGPVPGASGSGALMTLEFSAAAAGSDSFSFSRNTAIDSSAQTLSDLSWSAGAVSVTL
jgi:hypothetical protein